MLLGVVGTGQAPTDAKRPVGVISLIKPDRRLRGDSIPSKLLNCSEETRRGKVKENTPEISASGLPETKAK
jgi:hypothetical protein